MFYRETGQFKSTYAADMALYPVREDRILVILFLVLGAVILPAIASEFVFQAMLIPFLIYYLAALGLNILTGYAGQLSLGTGAFMGVGAYACYKLITIFPDMNLLVAIFLSGFFSAGIGVIFGIPSLRIKGFYLAIATLAAQFFLSWLFTRWSWLYNDNTSGAIEVAPNQMLDITIAGPTAEPVVRYYIILGFVIVFTILALNITRSRIGRIWKAVRDFDIAAELIGIHLLKAKLSAFAVSSYIIGVAGALMVFLYKGAAEPILFDISLSFRILFMVIIGGLGSVLGSFFGSAFIVMLPVVINLVPSVLGIPVNSTVLEHINLMIIGGLIILFLIVEPHGFARLWALARQKLRLWPFPY